MFTEKELQAMLAKTYRRPKHTTYDQLCVIVRKLVAEIREHKKENKEN